MSVKIRPVKDRILVKILEPEEEVVDGGIIVTRQAARSGVREGIVLAVGNLYKGDLVPGDSVFLKAWCQGETRVNGGLVAFVKEPDIMAAAGE